jgi:hypothetical protein
MLAERPAAGIGSALLSRFDLTDEEVAKDAAHQLSRCADDFQFAAWARRWGDALVRHALDPLPAEGLEEAQEAANTAEEKLRELRNVAEAVLNEFDEAAVDLPDEPVNRLNDILAKLENAL